MAITFDPVNRRIILSSASTSAVELWSRWSDWVAADDNLKWLPAMRQVGGDDLGGGLLIPAYVFLLNGWRVRPMELDHTLTINGNLFVEGGSSSPVVQTLGNYNVLVQLVVPVQAQAVNTGGSGLSPEQDTLLNKVAKALLNKMVTDPATGKVTIYEQDGVTVFAQASLFEDAAGTQAYRGQGAERREALT